MKKREDLLKRAYQKVIEVGLGNRSIDDLSSFVEQDIMGYGTAIDEKILSITDFIDLVQLQRKQAVNFDDFYFTSNLVLTRLTDNDNTGIVVDEIELVTKIGNDTNKLNLRMTAVFEFKEDSWKLLHWHSSKPEHVSDGEDPWHVDEWKEKTEKLEQMVDEKTAELIKKNEELEVEASLERVRAVAMGMAKSEDLLNICEVSYKEFRKLGFNNLRNAVIHIPNDEQKYFMDYDYSEFTGGDIAKIEYGSHPIVDEYLEKIRSAADAYFEVVINKDQLSDWKEFRKNSGQSDDSRLDEAEALYYYLFSIGIGDIGISTFKPINKSQIKILKRFRNVFDLAYRRYNDIALAEAQAREAQIEAALERTRNKSMMMQYSDEVKDLSKIFHEQLIALNIPSEFSYIWLPNELKNEHMFWATWTETENNKSITKSKSVIYPLDKSEPYTAACFEAWKSDLHVHITKIEPKEIEQFFDTWKDLIKGAKNLNARNFPKGIFYAESYMKYGCFGINISRSLNKDEQNILYRFTIEFERAYTRFLDLKRAEEQAKEAKIQLALEKVRMVALGLNRSMEILQVAKALYEQLLELGFSNMRNALIDIKNGDDDTFTDYDYSHEMSGTITQMSYYDDPTLQGQFKKMATTTNDFFELVLEGKELEDLKAMRIKNGEDEDPRLLNIELLTYNLYSFGNGAIGISNFGILSPEEKNILSRFNNVFTFAYKRYTDLAQAEIQAREAKIELSLERIRAQATAMNESVDLLDIVVTMRREFVNLGHEAHYFWYMRYHPDIYEKAMTSGDGTRIGMVMTLPRHIHGDIKLLADWEKGDEPTVVFAMDVETAVDYVDKMISLGDFQQVDPNAPTLDDIRHIGGLTFVMARTTHGEIGYSLPGVVPDPHVEDLAILTRFAGVFDLAYKRFEDLKSSEQRNREAQIELALERVRAKTMAMQKSNELAQTSSYVFFQLNELGIKPYRCNIAIVDEELKNCILWSTTNSGNVIPTGSALPLNEFPVLQEMYDGWKSKRPIHEIKITGNVRLEWTRYIGKHLPFEEYKPHNINETDILNNPSYLYNLYFKQGFFTIHSKEGLAEDHLKIIQRFAYVFEQTYTRFLDLENAEKQNKIIQAENERKTEELEEARQLQLAMLPKEVPKLSNLDIAVFMKTATEVGGDYYDFHVDSKNNLTAIIGDATGHGMKAGTMVTITKSLFNSLASSRDILKTFKRISEVIKNMKFRQLSMCLQMIKINGSELSISSAAMPPAFIYRYDEDSVEEILLSGMPLGAMLNYQYKIEKRKLKSGDVIFLLSDGLPELHNHKKHMYGYDKVKTELKKVGKKTPQKIVEYFEHSTNEWLNGYEQDDDVTFVVIKIK